MSYKYCKTLDKSFEEVVAAARVELQKEGFGIITEIDVKATMKEKLDIEYEDYIILGACSPHFANDALNFDRDIGLLLPCNVIVYSKDEKTIICAINPVKAMSVMDNEELGPMAEKVKEKLEKVLDILDN